MLEEIIDAKTDAESSGLVINEQIKNELRKTIKWTTFLSILGFIAISIMFITALFMLSDNGGAFYRRTAQTTGTIYFFLSIIFSFPTYFMHRFSTKIKSALGLGGQISLNEAFVALRKQYQFAGILVIIVISIFAFLFVSAVALIGR